MPSFTEKLASIQARTQSDLGLWIAPQMEKLPLPIQRFDDPFLPFGKAIINATRDKVCAYIFDFPAYLVFGAVGIIALERTIDYIGNENISILHGGFTLQGYAHLMDEFSFGADALTLGANTSTKSFTTRPDRGVFVMQPSMTPPVYGVGEYYIDIGTMTITSSDSRLLKIQLLEQDLIYTGRQDDFADVLCRQIEQILNGR